MRIIKGPNIDPQGMPLGPTGDYPNGKANPDDKGGICIGITVDRQYMKSGLVRIVFGTSVTSIAMKPEQATQLGMTLIAKAAECGKKED